MTPPNAPGAGLLPDEIELARLAAALTPDDEWYVNTEYRKRLYVGMTSEGEDAINLHYWPGVLGSDEEAVWLNVAAFIVRSRNMVPVLLQRLQAERQELHTLKATLRTYFDAQAAYWHAMNNGGPTAAQGPHDALHAAEETLRAMVGWEMMVGEKGDRNGA